MALGAGDARASAAIHRPSVEGALRLHGVDSGKPDEKQRQNARQRMDCAGPSRRCRSDVANAVVRGCVDWPAAWSTAKAVPLGAPHSKRFADVFPPARPVTRSRCPRRVGTAPTGRRFGLSASDTRFESGDEPPHSKALARAPTSDLRSLISARCPLTSDL